MFFLFFFHILCLRKSLIFVRKEENFFFNIYFPGQIKSMRLYVFFFFIIFLFKHLGVFDVGSNLILHDWPML